METDVSGYAFGYKVSDDEASPTLDNGSLDDEDRAIVVENWPDYQEMVDTDDLGLYLK